MTGRPKKLHEPCAKLNAVIYESQYQQITEVSAMLSEREGRHVSKGDLMRVAVELMLDLPANDILERIRA